MSYISKGKELTAAEVSVLEQIVSLGSALQYLRVNAAGNGLEYATLVASGGFTVLSTADSVNGSNVDFIFTEKPDYIVSDHAWYTENVGWTWNGGTLTASMAIPPSDEIYGFT